MAIRVKIPIQELTISIQEIASLKDLSYGIFDEHGCLDEYKVGKTTYLYDKNRLARGIEVLIDHHDVLLNLSLPTSPSEIELFYILIEKICDLFHRNQFYRNEELVFLHELPSFIHQDLSLCHELLKKIHEKLQSHEFERFIILGIMNPISIGLKEIHEINDSLNHLEEFLDRLQKMDVFYANPTIYKKKDNSLFGGYFIGENIETVIPTKPDRMFNEKEFIEDWFVFFPEQKVLNYDFFIQHVPSTYYDENHRIVNLTRNDVNELFDKHYDEMNKERY